MPEMVHKLEASLVAKMRREGCVFIRAVGTQLNMFKPALSSACVFFARFYARNGFLDKKPTSWGDTDWVEWRKAQLPTRYKDLNWRFIAMACLFLAGKVEDNPKKIYDLVVQFHKQMPKMEQLVDPELTDAHLRQLKETLFAYERLVMQDLDFDMIVEAPVAFNQVAQHIKFMCLSVYGAGKARQGSSSAPPTTLDPHGHQIQMQMLRLALDFVENSFLTTLWLEYDAPTIAFGIVWLTAKFYDFGGPHEMPGGWWSLMNERFETQNKREDPNTGDIYRMKAPIAELLNDIGMQLLQYQSEAYERGKPLVPPLPQLSSGKADLIEGEDPTQVPHPTALPFIWRQICLTEESTEKEYGRKGGSKGPLPVIISKEGDILSCTCEVWKGLAASKVPEHQRTCRCLMSYNGMEAERLRVGEAHADTCHRLSCLQALKRPKLR